MELATFRYIMSPAGQRLLAEVGARLAAGDTLLSLVTHFRRRSAHSPEQISAAIEVETLRQRGEKKFVRAGQMYFTKAALEQASGELVARYRADRYHALGIHRVADLCCGVGGDSLALATSDLMVTGVDNDELRLAMACENLVAYDAREQFQPLLADLKQWLPAGFDALFFDPGRRTADGRRVYSVRDYQPPLPIIDRWLTTVSNLGVKISPGVDYAELPANAEVEFISNHGEVKEAVLWFGDLDSGVGRRATLLPGRDTITDEPTPAIAVTPPCRFLYEPDGAVIRAHLVEQLAMRLAATKIDPTIAYLTSDDLIPTPFARAFEIEEYADFNLKKLRARLRTLGVGHVVIKKRGSPIDPTELAHRLRLSGSEERTLFLTHLDGQPSVLIGHSIASKGK